MNIEDEIKDRFDYKTLTETSRMIQDDGNKYFVYETETKSKIYVHIRQDVEAWPMFESMMNSYNQIRATGTIYAPEPVGIFGDPASQGCGFVHEYVDVEPETDWKVAGRDLAAMHFDNYANLKKQEKRSGWIGGKIPAEDGSTIEVEDKPAYGQFGFIDHHLPSLYGKHDFPNIWEEDWIQFFSQRRLEVLFRSVISKHGDREIVELWSNLAPQLDRPFAKLTTPIVPALLHGNLDTEKIASIVQTVPTEPEEQDDDGLPDTKTVKRGILLEPISVYGHSEFDLAKIKISQKIFPTEFYEEYHKKIKRQDGFEERSLLYQLFFAALDYEKNESMVKSLMRQLLR